MGPYVLRAGAGAQRRSVHAERVHGHFGDVAQVADPPGGARDVTAGAVRARTVRPGAPGRPAVHVRAEDRLAAIEERRGPPPGVKAGVVGAEQAGQQGPAHLAGEQPVIFRRRPRRMPEVRDAGVACGVTEPFPQQPGHQAQVIVLDQHPGAAWRRPAVACCRGQRVGERLVVGLVRLPVALELGAELRLVRDVEQQVVQEPQGGVGHVVVRAVEGVRRDVKHPHGQAGPRNPLARVALARVPLARVALARVALARVLPARDRAVRVAERGADPGHLGLGRHGLKARRHPGDHAAAAALTRQRAIRAELVRNRTPIRCHQHPLLHNPAG